MHLFVLNANIGNCARYHAEQRVVKVILLKIVWPFAGNRKELRGLSPAKSFLEKPYESYLLEKETKK